MVWRLDVYVEECQLTPDWEARVAQVLREASDLYRSPERGRGASAS